MKFYSIVKMVDDMEVAFKEGDAREFFGEERLEKIIKGEDYFFVGNEITEDEYYNVLQNS